jgi:hypothetical protein
MKQFNHGNRLRPVIEAYETKKVRSINAYAQKCLALDPYWRNEKILREHYHLYDPGKAIDPQLLENEGFDFNLTKTKMIINGHEFDVMNKFGYRFTQNEQIILCKI